MGRKCWTLSTDISKLRQDRQDRCPIVRKWGLQWPLPCWGFHAWIAEIWQVLHCNTVISPSLPFKVFTIRYGRFRIQPVSSLELSCSKFNPSCSVDNYDNTFNILTQCCEVKNKLAIKTKVIVSPATAISKTLTTQAIENIQLCSQFSLKAHFINPF